MKNKPNFIGFITIVIITSALTFAFTACDTGSSNGGNNNNNSGTETWSDITNLNQINGTWKGTGTRTEDLGELWDDTNYAGITVRIVEELTMTINASAGTGTSTGKITGTFSGGTISSKWADIKNGINVPYPTTFNDATYTVTFTLPPETGPLNLSNFAGFKISNDGKKLKGETGEVGEVILTKQP